MSTLTDEQLLKNAYNKGVNGVSKDVFELFKELIKQEEEE